MITTELLNNGKLIRTYSDSGKYVQQETGAVYSEAVDVYPSSHTYTEVEPPEGEGNASPGIGADVLVAEIKKLSAKVEANAESQQMLEDCVVEMAEIIYE